MTGSSDATARPRLLVVDDEPIERAELVRILVRAGYTVSQAASAGDALRKILAEPPQLVVLDLRLPDATGVEVAGAIRAVAGTERMPLVVVTAYSDDAAALDPKRFHAECVLTKPIDAAELRAAVVRCLDKPAPDQSTSPLDSPGPAAAI